MKRIALLLIALTALFCLTAHAEALPEDYAAVTILRRGDYLMALADAPDGARVFIGGVQAEDGWRYAISTPLPEGTVLFTEEGAAEPYAVLGFHHPQNGQWVEHFVRPTGSWELVTRVDGTVEVFVPDESAAWEIRMTVCGDEEICYHYLSGEGIFSDLQFPYYGTFTLPLDVAQADWLKLPLTYVDAVSLMDTTGCEDKNARWVPYEPFGHEIDPGLTAFVEAQLPGYSAWDGAVTETQAALLADDAQGVRYFITGECLGGAWQFAVSQPLPEGTGIDAYLVDEYASAELYIPLPREKQRLYDGIRDMEAYVQLQEGTWRVAGVSTGHGVLTFERHAITEDVGAAYYGDLLIDTDASRTDWSALPHSWASAMACVDTANWRIVRAAPADLRAEANGDSALLGRYFSGAPVRVLAEKDGWVQVEPLGTGLTGWMAAADLIPASEQLYQPWVDDPAWHSTDYRDNLYPLPEAILEDEDPVVTLYAMPHDDSTAAPFVVTHVAYVRLPGLCAQGCCYHVYHEESGASGWIPVAEMPRDYQDFAFIANHAPGYVHSFHYNGVYMGETTVMALVHEPGQHPQNGGSMRFMGAALVDGAWQVTLSTPFPAGMWPSIDTYHAGDGTIAVGFCHPELFAQYAAEGAEDPDLWADRGYVIELRDGAWKIVTVGGEMAEAFFMDDHAVCDTYGFEWYGDFTFERDVTQVDWLAFPTTLAEVLDQTDSSQWSILWAAEFLRAEPQGESDILGEYFPGTWVRLLDKQDGWQRVAFPDGVTGWMEAEVLAVPDSAPMIAELPLVRTGSRIVSVMGQTVDGAVYHICDIADGLTCFIPAADCAPYLGELYWLKWPMTEGEALAQAIDSGWVFLNTSVRLLVEPVDGALNHGKYRPGVWAEVIEVRGEWSCIRIHDAADGWVRTACLTEARDMTLLPAPPKMKLRMGEPAVQLYDAPEGSVISEYYTDWPETVTLLGDTGTGWYHVHDGINAGYIRQTDCEGYK